VTKWLLALALLGCEAKGETLGRDGEYFRDKRTNLCFVYWVTWSNSGAREIATNVPCTDEVMKLVLQSEGRKD
jgi:hypothetical protein